MKDAYIKMRVRERDGEREILTDGGNSMKMGSGGRIFRVFLVVYGSGGKL